MKGEARLPFYLAMQYIRRGNIWTLLLTIFLMAVAFVNLIFVSSLFTGIIDGTNKQIINTLTGNIYITPLSGDDTIKNPKDIVEKAKATDGVAAASAEMLVPSALSLGNNKGSWQVIAINPDDERTVTNVSDKMLAGSYLDTNDTDTIILGRQIAGGEGVEENAFSLKGASVGDAVTLSFDGVTKKLTVKGIFNTKFLDADKRAFITQKTLDSMVPGMGDLATTIAIKIEDGESEEVVIQRLEENDITGTFYTWKEVTGLMQSVSDSFLSINVLMTTVGMLIAAVTIFIIIYVNIVNKRKQIGILRAIGIKSYIIVFSYVILSAFYSVLGVIVGTVIFVAAVMPYFQAHPFVLPICDAVLVLDKTDYIARAEAIIWVSVLAGLIPAAFVVRGKMLNAILGK